MAFELIYVLFETTIRVMFEKINYSITLVQDIRHNVEISLAKLKKNKTTVELFLVAKIYNSVGCKHFGGGS